MALALLGVFYSFTLFYPFGLLSGIVGAFLGAMPGFIFVVLFEVAQLQFEKVNELKRQTALLEKLVEDKNEEVSDN